MSIHPRDFNGVSLGGIQSTGTINTPLGTGQTTGNRRFGFDTPPEVLIDDTGQTAENEDTDSDDWTDRPATRNDGCSPEPLDDGVPDCYALHEPITTDADMVDKDRYLGDNGRPLTHFDAVGSYIEQRHSEGTTAKRHGWTKGRRYYTKQQYRRGMALDRQLLTVYENPTAVLLSLRISPPDAGRLTMLTEVTKGADKTIDKIRYELQEAPDAPFDAGEWEFMAVFAGTEERATPHLHIYVVVDGNVSPERFEPVVDKFVEKCEYAPDDGTGNKPEQGAVSVRGNGSDSIPIVDDVNPPDSANGENSRGAVYILTQLPHHKDVDKMARDELLHSATMDAWGGQAFRASLSKSEIRDDFLAVGPVSSDGEEPV